MYVLQPRKRDLPPIDPKNKENLGPFPASSNASPKFKSNFSVNFLRKYEVWNVHYQPFKLYQSTPWDSSLPEIPDRPVPVTANAQPKANHTSKKNPGVPYDGMPPEEQFTIVIMTYKREAVLLQTLQKLYPLPYLNKVVIVWNTPYPPPANFTWPDIGAPLEVRK